MEGYAPTIFLAEIEELKKEKDTYKARYEYMEEFNTDIVKRKQQTDKLNESLVKQLKQLQEEKRMIERENQELASVNRQLEETQCCKGVQCDVI